MNFTEWDKKFEIGVESIDKEHKQLFAILKKLLTMIDNQEKSEFAFREGIKYLKNHTMEHFAHEEDYMLSIHYGDYEIHKKIHDNFRNNTLPALDSELNEMHYSDSSVRHFVGVVIGWLFSHTITADMAIAGKNAKKWTNVPQEKYIEVLEQSIIQTWYNIFQQKLKTVSIHYDGEDFGTMVGISLTYRGKKDGTWNVILSFEEKLLLTIVNGMLNSDYKRSNDMVINITRHISRQLVENIRESFPLLDFFELEGESLLSYEQISRIHELEPPSFSMLFTTGKGYFSMGITVSDSIQSEIMGSNAEEDVTSDIWKYLNRGKQKKKVLIVDDSDFMRFSIVKLLQDDYEVVESGSAMSAIVKIVTDKPDLVILDYEMPVCDGRQMLAMLRSEKETMDIPVIFLTGRGDTESIQMVMALKPSGYLLKTKPKEYIKKAIDGFFAQLNGKEC